MTSRRVVLDTNVIVSGLRSRAGASFRLLRVIGKRNFITTVAEKVSALTTETYLEERAKRGSRKKFEAVLAKVPDVEPDEWDKL